MLNYCTNVYSVGVLEEAKFFGISKAIDPLETIVRVFQYTYHSFVCSHVSAIALCTIMS